MKIGPLEIIVILFVIFIVAAAFRLFRGDRSLAAQGKKDSVDVTVREPVSGRGQFKLAGILLVVFGIIALAFGSRLFQMVFRMYSWALVLVGIGIVVLVVLRKR